MSHRISTIVSHLTQTKRSSGVATNVTSNQTKRFEGQVAIITGGLGGLGEGIAARLAEEGAKIVLVDQKAELLEKVSKNLQSRGYEVIWFAVDVTDQKQIENSVTQTVNKYGKVDVLVQCAGITGKTGIKTHEVDPSNFDLVMDINVKGIFLYCKAVLPHMTKKNYGRIVNIASVAGKEGNAGMLAYSTSKAAVIGLTKVMGKEYAETGITVNALAPAVVRTPMVAAMPDTQVKYMTDKIPMKRCGAVTEIAGLVAYIASPESGFTTAFCFDATGGRSTY